MSLSYVVQHITGDWPINTTEDHIAVQGRSIRLFVMDRFWKCDDFNAVSGGIPVYGLGSDFDFLFTYIAGSRVEQPIEVVFFHAIGVDQGNSSDAYTSHSLCDNRSHAAEAHNTDP